MATCPSDLGHLCYKSANQSVHVCIALHAISPNVNFANISPIVICWTDEYWLEKSCISPKLCLILNSNLKIDLQYAFILNEVANKINFFFIKSLIKSPGGQMCPTCHQMNNPVIVLFLSFKHFKALFSYIERFWIKCSNSFQNKL